MWSFATQVHFSKKAQFTVEWFVASIVVKSEAKRMVVT